MSRHIAPLTALLLFSALPFAVSAETRDTRDYRAERFCDQALKDPVAFMQRRDFDRRLLRMADACPELALSLTNVATGSIPTKAQSHSGKGPSFEAVDYSDLIARLTAAKADVEDATSKVASARQKLEGTIRRARSTGISEEELDALSPILEDEDDVARLLPDFTADKRRALENFVAARDRLATAQRNLDTANREAEPLVRTALELAGLADTARGNLANALGNMTAAERQAMLDAAVDAANRALADVQSRLAQSRADLQAAIDRLNGTYHSDRYQNAHNAFYAAKADAEQGHEKLAKAQADVAAARERVENCHGRSCGDARRDLERAEDYLTAVEQYAGHRDIIYEETLADLRAVMAEMQTYEQQQAIAALTAGIIADEATEASAGQAAQDAARQARELADLITSTAAALANAEAASAEARAATATEEAAVVSARAALETALAAARSALAGSAEEAAALAAVQAAKEELQAALVELGTAQDVAEELADEVADIPNAPAAVTDPADDLENADEAGDAAAEAAQETIDDADAAIADNADATSDLSEAVEDATETTTETTGGDA
ncbi:hypothetical protein [Tabrizicola sp. M-4]|uniref:hypothetical protein n=1 Tax=Tabrizicola sp. M-4 TaxID=3055847 RepID=UPI003DA7F2CC